MLQPPQREKTEASNQNNRPSRRTLLKSVGTVASIPAAVGCFSNASRNGTSIASSNRENQSSPTQNATDSPPDQIDLEDIAKEKDKEDINLDHGFDHDNRSAVAEFFLKTLVLSTHLNSDEVNKLRSRHRNRLSESQIEALARYIRNNTVIISRGTNTATPSVNRTNSTGKYIKKLSRNKNIFESRPCPASPVSESHTRVINVTTFVPCSALHIIWDPSCSDHPRGFFEVTYKAAEYSNTITYDVSCNNGVPEFPEGTPGSTRVVPGPKTHDYGLIGWDYIETIKQSEFKSRQSPTRVSSSYRGWFARKVIDGGTGFIRVAKDWATIDMAGYKDGHVAKSSTVGSTNNFVEQ